MHGIESPQRQQAAKPRPQRPRAGPRRDVNKRAVILLPRGGRPHPVFLRNISALGACVQTDVALRLGDDLRLRAELDPGGKACVDAIVIGIRPRPKLLYTEYGLRFLRVDAEAAAAIVAYVGAQAAARHA
ncbi:MAG TPA: PilZ domain-containing protein [Candidatus Eremiobacteraceae bacterium]|nr:PilZ domain-containing protein [Candidatus Eremiobacteraceae bacterium]